MDTRNTGRLCWDAETPVLSTPTPFPTSNNPPSTFESCDPKLHSNLTQTTSISSIPIASLVSFGDSVEGTEGAVRPESLQEYEERGGARKKVKNVTPSTPPSTTPLQPSQNVPPHTALLRSNPHPYTPTSDPKTPVRSDENRFEIGAGTILSAPKNHPGVYNFEGFEIGARDRPSSGAILSSPKTHPGVYNLDGFKIGARDMPTSGAILSSPETHPGEVYNFGTEFKSRGVAKNTENTLNFEPTLNPGTRTGRERVIENSGLSSCQREMNPEIIPVVSSNGFYQSEPYVRTSENYINQRISVNYVGVLQQGTRDLKLNPGATLNLTNMNPTPSTSNTGATLNPRVSSSNPSANLNHSATNLNPHPDLNPSATLNLDPNTNSSASNFNPSASSNPSNLNLNHSATSNPQNPNPSANVNPKPMIKPGELILNPSTRDLKPGVGGGGVGSGWWRGKEVGCTPECRIAFESMGVELGQARQQLFTVSLQMEEQASHINKLLEENRRYIREHGKLKKNTSNSSTSSTSSRDSAQFLSTDGYTSDTYGRNSRNSTPDYSLDYGTSMQGYSAGGDLQDRVSSLQVQNSELNVCLERERRKRREAEEKVERDESYIKRLEDCIQTLKGTRVVMDPSTYRQLAEAYMASQRMPAARRPHSHTPTHHPSDLVCDNLNPHQRLSHPVFPVTSSCPSSPVSSNSSSSSDSKSFRTGGRSKKERKDLGGGGGGGSLRGVGSGGPMNTWDYQQLLESLENLDGGSRGALS